MAAWYLDIDLTAAAEPDQRPHGKRTMYALARQDTHHPRPDRWAITVADPDGDRLVLRYLTWR